MADPASTVRRMLRYERALGAIAGLLVGIGVIVVIESFASTIDRVAPTWLPSLSLAVDSLPGNPGPAAAAALLAIALGLGAWLGPRARQGSLHVIPLYLVSLAVVVSAWTLAITALHLALTGAADALFLPVEKTLIVAVAFVQVAVVVLFPGVCIWYAVLRASSRVSPPTSLQRSER